MKKIFYLFFAAALFFTTSCTTVKHTSQTVDVQTSIVSLTVVDLDVAPQKATKTLSWNYQLFCPVSVEDMKDKVKAQLIQETGADALVEPEFVVEKRGWMRGGSVTVTGYPARFRDFHSVTPEEAVMLQAAPGGPFGKAAKKQKHKKKFIVF